MVCKAAAGVDGNAGQRLGLWSLSVCEREQFVFICVCVCRLDLLHDTGAGDGKTVVLVWSCGIGRGRWLG